MHAADDYKCTATVIPWTSARTRTGATFAPKPKPKKILSLDHAEAHGIQRLRRLRTVEAEVRSANALVRTMCGQGLVLRLSAIKKQRISVLVATIIVRGVKTESGGWTAH